MKRVFLMVLDSFGIGSSLDADKFDIGANTLGHIAEKCFLGQANISRQGFLCIPNLVRLGIAKAYFSFNGKYPLGLSHDNHDIIASYGFASEISFGKDTVSGHWEIAGIPILNDWYYFKKKDNTFPPILIDEIVNTLNFPGILGNCHASGTDIIKNFGEMHIKTGKPILYTSLDSVLQVACHENIFDLSNIYKICNTIRYILDKNKYKIARVIARPFIGVNKFDFLRTKNRRDFSLKPFSSTVMEKLIQERRGNVVAIGKVSDIYSGCGITRSIQAFGLDQLCRMTMHEMKKAENNTIVFTNFVDFDALWGHRRDVSGYARGLEFFDSKLSAMINLVQEKDLLIITADHGCDPTWQGTDHTRENVPILLYSPSKKIHFLGHRKTFSDIGQTIAKYFHLSDMQYGISMI